MKSTRTEPAEILIIDEDALALANSATALEAAGYLVYQAQNRVSALRIARTRALDLLICDVNLADGSGLELTRDLRRLPGIQDVPVMFVSRSQLPDIVRRSHEAGAAYYLRKPLDPEVLVDLVRKALWLPHLVETRLAMHHAGSRALRAPRIRSAARTALVQGIRLPLA